ncbi:hypothetical protein CUMW_265650, partial [Citrus unshiu]
PAGVCAPPRPTLAPSLLFVPSHISGTGIIPSPLHQYPLFEITEILSSSPPLPPPPPCCHAQSNASRPSKPLSTREPETRPICAVIDVMMGWTADVFKNFEGPIVGFFTSGACSAAWSVPLLRDREMRTNRGSKLDEYLVLANALEVSNEPFIWVIQTGAGRLDPPCHLTGLDRPAEGNYFHSGLGSKASKKGLIIDGWAPQLLILNHQSMAWPIRDDQHYNAKLVINHLKVGYMISNDQSKSIQKNDIVIGIEKLMSDQEIKKRAHMLRRIFYQGFPMSSVASLNAFKDLISQKSV